MSLQHLQSLHALKTADEDVTSSTTLQDDNELTITVTAAGIYIVRALIFASETASGMKYALGGTATVTSMKVHGLIYDTALRESARVTALASPVTHATAGGGNHFITLQGQLTINAAGTILLSWAQNSSDVVALTTQAGSTLTLERVA